MVSGQEYFSGNYINPAVAISAFTKGEGSASALALRSVSRISWQEPRYVGISKSQSESVHTSSKRI